MSSYYYDELDEEQKGVYSMVFDGINDLDAEIELPLITQDSLYSVFSAVLLDNPIFFYTRAYQHLSDITNGRLILMPVYKYLDDFTNQSAGLLSDFLCLFDCVKNESDIEKELYVHDYCLKNFKYDHSFNEWAFSILGPIIHGAGVCEGIAKFVKIALNYLGVYCIVVSGKALNPASNLRDAEPHMWNIVSIDGEMYHLDVTFNLSQTGITNRYDYFNLPDNEIKREHFITDNVPICDVSGNDYYSLSSQVVYNLFEVETYIKKELLGRKNSVVFKLKGTQCDAGIVDYIISIALRQYQSIFSHKVQVQVKFNPSQYVFEINFI